MNRRIAMACGDYDRTRALADGTVRVQGVDLTYLTLTAEETFFRMMRYEEFDIAEMSLSSYVLSLDFDDPPFIAIPVFPSRAFRHSGIFINAEGGIASPEDLVGRRVGLPEYQLTACVWIRGILEDFHGVPHDAVTYVTGGLEDPARIEKSALRLPDRIRIESAPRGATLAQMLDAGELDAIYAPRTPSTYGNGRVTRLFPDVQGVEASYFRETGIFPTMHAVVIQRRLYEEAPWLAMNLVTAFTQALDLALPKLRDTTALHYSLPWLVQHAEDAAAAMGENPWKYGLAHNHATIDRFLDYSHRQGLAQVRRSPEELFAAETRERFAV